MTDAKHDIKILFSKTLLSRCHIKAFMSMPVEACGLLVGRKKKGHWIVEDVVFSENLAKDPSNSFEIDPKLHLEVQREVRANKKHIVGVWHSHPSGSLAPSAYDIERSVLPEYAWLISAPQAHGEDSERLSWKSQLYITGQDPQEFTIQTYQILPV